MQINGRHNIQKMMHNGNPAGHPIYLAVRQYIKIMPFLRSFPMPQKLVQMDQLCVKIIEWNLGKSIQILWH
jgi:hypothetical protein